MKKTYTAPAAQLICLAPHESIATPGWFDGGDSWWTKGFFWGAQPTADASIPNTLWYEFDFQSELDPDKQA